jgi:hypothetical protein
MKQTRYWVVSKRGDSDENFVESIRTSKKAADEDVQLLKDISRRHAWIEEHS